MKLLNLLVLTGFLILGATNIHGQIKIGGESPLSYATAYLRINPESNEVNLHAHITGSYREASVQFPAGTDEALVKACREFTKTLRSGNELLNWMAHRGWKLVSSNIMNSTENDDNSYLQILIFEKND